MELLSGEQGKSIALTPSSYVPQGILWGWARQMLPFKGIAGGS